MVVVFLTCPITANVTAVKLVGIVALMLLAGVIIFPVSYIVGDVLTEVYGFRQARRMFWLSFFCNLLVIWLGGSLAGREGLH